MNDTNTDISIIIVVHDQAYLLEQNLPQFMDVAAAVGCEVIIVDDESTDETPDVLKQMKIEYPTLYTTFLPRSVVINPNRQRLAFTIGIKAAHSQQVVLADISRPPLSEAWLSGLVADDSEAVLVYSGRKGDRLCHQSMTSLEEAIPFIRKAERKSGHGHHGKWFKYRRGLYDAISIQKACIFEAIKHFDQDIHGYQLMKLRIRIICKNLF